MNKSTRYSPEVRTEASRQTHEVRSEGPSGAAASPSSHPDDFDRLGILRLVRTYGRLVVFNADVAKFL